jgi:hypothetical protein
MPAGAPRCLQGQRVLGCRRKMRCSPRLIGVFAFGLPAAVIARSVESTRGFDAYVVPAPVRNDCCHNDCYRSDALNNQTVKVNYDGPKLNGECVELLLEKHLPSDFASLSRRTQSRWPCDKAISQRDGLSKVSVVAGHFQVRPPGGNQTHDSKNCKTRDSQATLRFIHARSRLPCLPPDGNRPFADAVRMTFGPMRAAC